MKQLEEPQPKPQVEQETPQEKIKINHKDGGDLMVKKASGYPNKLEKKAQANKDKQGNEKHNMRKEEKAKSKRKCYSCQERGHMAYLCPLGNTPKIISIDDDSMLRKDGNCTSMVAIAKHPATHTKIFLSMLLLT